LKYISFSLFGHEPDYILGAVANAKECDTFYPGWTPVFYVAPEIEQKIIDQLLATGAVVIPGGPEISKNPRIWRFAAALLPEAKLTLFRDTDSRFSKREVEAVAQWVKSENQLHIIRDHPRHYYPIMAGMWGVRSTEYVRSTIKQILLSANGADKPEDQTLLAKIFYPKFKDDALVHDAFFTREKNRATLIDREPNGSFIGEQIDSAGNPNLSHRELASRYERNLILALRLKYFDKLREAIHKVFRLNFYFLLKTGKTERS